MSPRVTTSAVKLNHAVIHAAGSQSSNTGNVVVCHGFLGSSANWATVGRKLAHHPLIADRLANMYALDMRNHGGSPHTDLHTNAAMSSDVETFLLEKTRQVGTAGRTVLVGHSMGGAVVMNLLYRRHQAETLRELKRRELLIDAQDNVGCMDDVDLSYQRSHPGDSSGPGSWFSPLYGGERGDSKPAGGRVSAAVIIDIAPLSTSMPTPAPFERVERDLKAMSQVDLSQVRSLSDANKQLEHLGVTSSGMRSFLLTNLKSHPSSSSGPATTRYDWRCNLPILTRDFHHIRPSIDPDTMNRHVVMSSKREQNSCAPLVQLKRCDIPLLFVFGAKSPYNTVENRNRIGTYFSNVEALEIPDAGHFVHYEKMDAFAEAVAPFLYEHMQP